MTAVRRPARVDGRPVDIGLVGDIVDVNPGMVRTLLEQGHIPVVSPVARGADGQVYNVNADLAASALAVALDAERLVMLTDVAGLYADWPHSTEVIERLTADALEELLPGLASGMLPKMEGCLRAVRGGVRRAQVLDGRVPHAVLRRHPRRDRPRHHRGCRTHGPGRGAHADGSQDLPRGSARRAAGPGTPPRTGRQAHGRGREPVPEEQAATAGRRREQGAERPGARPDQHRAQERGSHAASLPAARPRRSCTRRRRVRGPPPVRPGARAAPRSRRGCRRGPPSRGSRPRGRRRARRGRSRRAPERTKGCDRRGQFGGVLRSGGADGARRREKRVRPRGGARRCRDQGLPSSVGGRRCPRWAVRRVGSAVRGRREGPGAQIGPVGLDEVQARFPGVLGEGDRPPPGTSAKDGQREY